MKHKIFVWAHAQYGDESIMECSQGNPAQPSQLDSGANSVTTLFQIFFGSLTNQYVPSRSSAVIHFNSCEQGIVDSARVGSPLIILTMS
jgi:hypothetical protein